MGCHEPFRVFQARKGFSAGIFILMNMLQVFLWIGVDTRTSAIGYGVVSQCVHLFVMLIVSSIPAFSESVKDERLDKLPKRDIIKRMEGM